MRATSKSHNAAGTETAAERSRSGDRLTLMYHNVTTPGEVFGQIGESITRYFVTNEQFDSHLDALANATSQLYSAVTHFRVAPNGRRLSELTEVRSPADPHSGSAIHVELTFDDGWAGSFERTLDALERHNMTATVFVTTGLIGQPHFADKALLRDAVATGRFRVGAHGVTHRLLELLTPAEIDRELRESKQTLEDIVGADVDTFALPGGSCSPYVRRVAKQLGYRELHNSTPSISPLIPNNALFEIPRFAVQRETQIADLQDWLNKPLGVKAVLKESTLSLAKSLLGRRRYAALRNRLLGSHDDCDMTDLLPEEFTSHEAAGRQERPN